MIFVTSIITSQFAFAQTARDVLQERDNSNSTRNIQVTEDIDQTKILKIRDFVWTPIK